MCVSVCVGESPVCVLYRHKKLYRQKVCPVSKQAHVYTPPLQTPRQWSWRGASFSLRSRASHRSSVRSCLVAARESPRVSRLTRDLSHASPPPRTWRSQPSHFCPRCAHSWTLARPPLCRHTGRRDCSQHAQRAGRRPGFQSASSRRVRAPRHPARHRGTLRTTTAKPQ